VESAHAEVHKKPLDKGGWLPHRVEFSTRPKKRKKTAIFDKEIDEDVTTDRIYPRELMAVERVYDFPDPDTVVHVGLQVKLKKRRWIFFFPLHQQTTTAYFVKPAQQGS
jgi:hypothetical protein